MYQETHARALTKAFSWRIAGTVTTGLVVYLSTSKLDIALYAGAIEFVSKIALFFFHERIWERVKFGRRLIEPKVIWFTGLSGAGKSTISEKVRAALETRNLKVEHLDGDRVRE